MLRFRKQCGTLDLSGQAQIRQLLAIVENCGNTLILRYSASERGGTSEFASRLIGRREVLRRQVSQTRPLSMGGFLHRTQTAGDHHVTEDAVMASEIEQLPDLRGFLKVASRPQWSRVTISR